MTEKRILTCFKAYDIRGKLGEEINENIAYRIGRSIAEILGTSCVVLGYDARETSPKLSEAVTAGICDAGADVFAIGLAGTEEVYCAVSKLNADAGVVITASHNPIDYNGMKIVKRSSKPLTEREFLNLRIRAERKNFKVPKKKGLLIDKKAVARRLYLEKVLSFVDIQNLKPLKIVINSGNGTAGPVVDALSMVLKDGGINTDFVFVNHTPDSSFPAGIPNPLLEENRASTSDIVKKEKADFGIAFDGDFDRCFFFDNLGNFVRSEYLTGIIAGIFLKKYIGAKIVHDPRVIWNITDIVKGYDGQAIVSKTGHAFMKGVMRKEKAVYGGEMSAHHYFRDFFYCDSGMITWLLIWELLSKNNDSLADIISQRMLLFPSSGEINFTVSDASYCMDKIKESFIQSATAIDEVDGLSLSFDKWRFNLRKSNTEPLLRLNVETKGDEKLQIAKIILLFY